MSKINVALYRSTLGREIAAERTRRGLTQAELAKAAEITPRQMGKIERGERGQLDEVWRVADALGLDFSVLVTEAEARARSNAG